MGREKCHFWLFTLKFHFLIFSFFYSFNYYNCTFSAKKKCQRWNWLENHAIPSLSSALFEMINLKKDSKISKSVKKIIKYEKSMRNKISSS